MRPLIFLLAAVLILGVTALATAGDCPGGVCPIKSKSIAVNITDVVEVTAVGIVIDRQPVRSTVKAIAGRRLVQAKIERRPASVLKAIVKNTQTRKPVRKMVARSKRVLKLPLRGLCRRR